MRIQVLTLRYRAACAGFDDGPLGEFVRSHRVLSVSEHFFYVDEVPHLACVVRWQDEPQSNGAGGSSEDPDRAPQGARQRPQVKRPRPDPAAELDSEQHERYERLRAWRRERARSESLPAFTLLTDRQLVALVRADPTSPEDLARVEGIGPGKARLFGEELLGAARPSISSRAGAASSDTGA